MSTPAGEQPGTEPTAAEATATEPTAVEATAMEPTAVEPTATTGPTLTTAPPRSRWRFGRVPSHIGPARTSTIVLAVLFVGFFLLYLAVRPESVATAGSTGGRPAPIEQPTPTRTTTRTATPTPTTRSATPTGTRSATPSSGATSARTSSSSSAGATDTGSSTTGGQPSLPLPGTGSAPTS